MPIRKHGSGWEVRLQHGGRRFSKTVATRSDAQFLEARLRQRVNDSRAGRVSTYSLEEALARWLANEAKHLRAQDSIRYISRALLPLIKGRSLHEVGEVAEATKRGSLAAGLMPATINRRLAVLKRIAKLAYKRWGWLENDLGAKIELLPGEVKRTVYVTKAQAKALMVAADPRTREVIRWALLTGLRRGEMMTLQPHQFRDRAIFLTDTKSGKPRTIPIPTELSPSQFPYGIQPTALARGFRTARKAAGLSEVRFHDLRRSYATWLAQAGGDVGAIRDLLGHSTTSMTSRYIGVSVRHLRKTIKTLPRLGFSGSGKPRRRGKTG